MILLVAIGVIAVLLLAYMLEGMLKVAAIVLLGCILFVFACDFFNVDWHPLVASQTRVAEHEARRIAKMRER
ncbi:MAG TPA: hypothetical protein VGY48_15795 [Vicinamibacterales bacterium]|jgi:fatty acid desaturase|nr:hypothetical protein [Vicinamibacterales bacterium]